MTLSPDSQAMLLLCSRLGLSNDPEAIPLTLRDWNPLARKLAASSLARPGALLGLGGPDLQRALDLSEPEAQRLSRLLQRGGGLAIELERLAGLGIHPLTRADPDYPARYRQRLKNRRPWSCSTPAARSCSVSPGWPSSARATSMKPGRIAPSSWAMPVLSLGWSCIRAGRAAWIRSA